MRYCILLPDEIYFRKGSYTQFLEEILSDSIIQEYQGQLREKLDLSYIKKVFERRRIDRDWIEATI